MDREKLSMMFLEGRVKVLKHHKEALLEALQTIVNDCQMILDGDDMSGMSDREIFGAMQKTALRAIAEAKGEK